ncbi:MAG TPA: ABC transporter ATP-binding protein [Bacteroidota bacterium]
MPDAILQARKLEKTYDDNGIPVYAVRSIDLEVYREDFLVIAGPSGSGKTTLLNLLGALDRPTAGSVLFEGTDLSSKNKSELASLRLNRMGFIFQAYNLIPVLTALENIEFTMMLRGVGQAERHRRARELMGELGIGDLADKRPNEMSGGQQQRVAIARAIVTNPAVVLADEPTANIDTATGKALLDLMEQMNREKHITFIFSSHDPQVIGRGRRLLLLRDGKIESDRG